MRSRVRTAFRSEWLPILLFAAALVPPALLLLCCGVAEMTPVAVGFALAMRPLGVTPGHVLYLPIAAYQVCGAFLVSMGVLRSILLARRTEDSDGGVPALGNLEAVFLGPLLLVGLSFPERLIALDSAGARFGEGLTFGSLATLDASRSLLVASAGVGCLILFYRWAVSGPVPRAADAGGTGTPSTKVHPWRKVIGLAAAALLAMVGLQSLPNIPRDLRMDIHYELPSNLLRPVGWWAASCVLALLAWPHRLGSSHSRRKWLAWLSLPAAFGLSGLLLETQILPGLWWSRAMEVHLAPEYFLHDTGKVWNLADYGIGAFSWFVAVLAVRRWMPRRAPPEDSIVVVSRLHSLAAAAIRWLSRVALFPILGGSVAGVGAAIWIFHASPLPETLDHGLYGFVFRSLGALESLTLSGQLFYAGLGWGRLTGACKPASANGCLRASLTISLLFPLWIGLKIVLYALRAGGP